MSSRWSWNEGRVDVDARRRPTRRCLAGRRFFTVAYQRLRRDVRATAACVKRDVSRGVTPPLSDGSRLRRSRLYQEGNELGGLSLARPESYGISGPPALSPDRLT